MTRLALITTTINVPTVLEKWAKTGMMKDDIIIVAGDLKSPEEEIVAVLNGITRDTGVNTKYLTPQSQERYRVSDTIGWNCIQRRNIALLAAMELQPRYILTIDDDNAPTSTSQVTQLIDIMNGDGIEVTKAQTITTNTQWYNPGRQCLTDQLRPVVHRGFPLSQRFVSPLMTYRDRVPVGVAAMLWTGEPDIDAVERIAVRPNVTRIARPSYIIAPGTWAPFNTQATMIRAEFAPALFMFPFVGRYDDIWASFVYRKVADKFGYGAYYGHPAVHQDRNEHDLVKDLEAELFGMKFNEQFIEVLRGIDISKDDTVWDCLVTIFTELINRAVFIPTDTVNAIVDWLYDVEAITRG